MTYRGANKRQIEHWPTFPEGTSEGRRVVKTMKLSSTPLGKDQCSYGMSRRLTAMGYGR